jgi:uncharacterized protein
VTLNATALQQIPMLGSGLGYRRELHEAIYEASELVDFVEIVTDQFIGNADRRAHLERLCADFVVIPHGVGMSIGSPKLDDDYLREVKLVSDVTRSPYYSEHLAMTRAPGLDIGHLAPLWWTEEMLHIVVDNVCRVQDFLGKPLILENITYLVDVPGNTMSQPAMFDRLVEATGCGVLLDVTNVCINGTNHGFDPVDFVSQMPVSHVVQIHLAGGFEHDGVMIDGHSEPVDDGSWALLEQVLAMTSSIRGCLVEHDANFPDDPSGLLAQVRRAGAMISGNTTRQG